MVTETASAGFDLVASTVQSYLQQESKFLPLVTDYSNLVVKGSKSVAIPRSGGFTVGAKSENTAVDAQIVTYAQDQIALTSHKVVQFLLEDIADMQAAPAIVEDMLMKAGKDLAREVDQTIINALELPSASTPDHRIAYAGTTVIAEADILDARELLIDQYIDPRECVLAVSPAQEKAMLKIANFIQAERYGNNEPIFNGEIGKVFGVKVIVHTDIEDLKSLMFHKSALGIAFQQGMKIEKQRDLANLGDRWSISHLYGTKLMDSGKRAVLIGTAS